MSNKPKPKTEVAISNIYPGLYIQFYATSDAASDFAEFGRLTQERETYILWVDARFDFDEVVEYIKDYG